MKYYRIFTIPTSNRRTNIIKINIHLVIEIPTLTGKRADIMVKYFNSGTLTIANNYPV